MPEVHTEDLLFPATVSLLGALQLARFSRRVGEARGKYKVPVPKTDGDPNFRRTFRAQQNTLEFYPVFMTLLWTSSVFLHHAIPSVFGLIYLYARHKYFYGYCQDAPQRLPGFRLAIKMLFILLLLSIAGLSSIAYTKYTGEKIDVLYYQEKALEFSKPVVDKANDTYKWISKTSEPYVISTRNHVKKAGEKITDVTGDLLIHLEIWVKFAYSQTCHFANKAAEKSTEVFSFLAEHFVTMKNSMAAYFQKPTKQEL